MASSRAKINIDSRKLRELQSKLRKATETLQVGWFPGARYDDATPVATVAAWQEFGTKTAPPRPFMRPAAENSRARWVQAYYGAAQQWINGTGTYGSVLTTVGLVVEADIKSEIVGGNHKPLSPVTLALRRLKNDNVPIGKRTVGMVAAAVAAGETGSGQLGQPFANQDPLRDTGYMLATLTYEVI